MNERLARPSVSLKALASQLGLSQTTVSRALNGHPGVSELTRARVVAAARAADYRPNTAARRLATGRAGAIGFVWVAEPVAHFDPVLSEVLSGIGESARDRGFAIQVTPTTREGELEAYRTLAASRQVDGVIVMSPALRDERVRLCEAIGLPFILHGRTDTDGAPHPFVDIDNRGAFRAAARLLLRLGHRRIGFLNGPERLTFARDRACGVNEAFREFDADPAGLLKRTRPMSETFGHEATSELLADDPPTAILCSSVVIALGAERALRGSGLRIGRDIAVISHDDVLPFLKPENFHVPLCCTTSSIRTAGRRLASRLIDRIHRGASANKGEVWDVDLIMRESVGPA